MGEEKTTGQVHRRGQSIRTKSAHAPVRRHEVKPRLRFKEVRDADRAAEMSEIGAATHADVLARIDELARLRIGEGTRSAAQSTARLQERDGKAPWCQCRRRRQAGETTTDDQDPIGHSGYFHPRRTGTDCTTRLSLRQRLKVTRLENTS